VQEPEPQWQQPSFPSESQPASAPVEGIVTSGSSVVRRGAVPPPSVIETVVGTVAGLVWPVMIVLAIMGAVAWWPAILIAIVGSAVLGNVRGHLKARRKAIGRGQALPPEQPNRRG